MERSGNWRSIIVNYRVLAGDRWNQEGYFTIWSNKACLYTNGNNPIERGLPGNIDFQVWGFLPKDRVRRKPSLKFIENEGIRSQSRALHIYPLCFTTKSVLSICPFRFVNKFPSVLRSTQHCIRHLLGSNSKHLDRSSHYT